ncbi:MAG: hypothetical protein AAFQ14_12615 [Cyanobacteria bacterium J06621_12]
MLHGEQFSLFNISPKVICFEITETVAISNLAIAFEMFQRPFQPIVRPLPGRNDQRIPATATN